MKERLNGFNTFNLTPKGHVSRFGWPETARAAHAGPAAREAAGSGERETVFWITWDTCSVMIGCPDSYHFNY